MLTILVRADEPTVPTKTPSSRVAVDAEELLRQLSDNDLRTRQEAERGLVALGSEVLAILPDKISDVALPAASAEAIADAEARLVRIRQRMQIASAKVDTAGTTVTLQGRVPLLEAFAAITAQTGNRIEDYRENFEDEVTNPPLDLELKNVPFWRALDEVCDQAGLSLYFSTGKPNRIAVVNRREDEVPAGERTGYSGVFRIEPTQLQATRDLRIPGNQYLGVSVEIAWEPRVLPIAVQIPLDSIEAKGSDGRKIYVAGRGETLEASVQRTISSVEMDIPLNLPRREVERIDTLRGQLVSILPGPEVTFTFDDLKSPRDVQQTSGGMTVTLERIYKNEDVFDVRIAVRFEDAGAALETSRSWIYDNTAKLVSPTGERLEADGLETTRQTEAEVGVAYKFAILGDSPPKDLTGYKFIYTSPVAIVNSELEFELKRIPLP